MPVLTTLDINSPTQPPLQVVNAHPTPLWAITAVRDGAVDGLLDFYLMDTGGFAIPNTQSQITISNTVICPWVLMAAALGASARPISVVACAWVSLSGGAIRIGRGGAKDGSGVRSGAPLPLSVRIPPYEAFWGRAAQ